MFTKQLNAAIFYSQKCRVAHFRTWTKTFRGSTRLYVVTSVFNRYAGKWLISSLVKFWKESLTCPTNTEMVKLCQKIHEYLNEDDKLFINLRRTKKLSKQWYKYRYWRFERHPSSDQVLYYVNTQHSVDFQSVVLRNLITIGWTLSLPSGEQEAFILNKV